MDRTVTLRSSKRNHPSVHHQPWVVDEYISSEQRVGRFSPPVPRELVMDCQQSPLGLIPKAQPGKWRLITDLSSPHNYSVNDGISPSLCSLHYCGLDEAVRIVLNLGRGARMSKVDLKSAYRVIPIHPDDTPLLGVKWNSSVLLDKALPFGLRSAPKIFSAFADALAWVTLQLGVDTQIHYLDDFFIAGPPGSPLCDQSYHRFLQCCQMLGVPVATDKLVPPTTTLIFLGIEVDSHNLQLRLPPDKLHRIQTLISSWQGKRSCKKRELQSLLGHLNHASKVVKPGRSFLRRMINLLPIATHPDHFIRLNAAFRADLLWWHVFIAEWNGISLIPATTVSVQVTSDASGSWGCGAFWDVHWFQLPWPEEWGDIPITAKELAPIVLAAMLWGHHWHGQRVQFVCDNMAVVACITSGSSRDQLVMHLLRSLWLISAHYQFDACAIHIPGQQNVAADALSRNHLTHFLSLLPQANHAPSQLPEQWIDMLLIQRRNWASPDWMNWLKTSL